MESNKNNYQKIKVSKAAYHFLKDRAKEDKYRGRGIIGVLDELTVGKFTTSGSGSYKNKKDKKT